MGKIKLTFRPDIKGARDYKQYYLTDLMKEAGYYRRRKMYGEVGLIEREIKRRHK